MGLFSDNCPECGTNVRRTAKFCGKCGKPGPKSWFKCPSCRKWVGGDSEFCWNCHAALHPNQRGVRSGGIWQRPAGMFAQRFDVDDLRGQLGKGVMVQAGTSAVLLDQGVLKDVLEPGRHTLDSLMQRLLHWGEPAPRTVILVDNGDVVLPLRIEGLRTREEMPVEFYGEVAIHFQAAGADRLVANLLKEKREVTCLEITEHLAGEIRYAVQNLCQQSLMEELIRDPERRLRLENTLQQTLSAALDRLGLALVRVASAEFAGTEYEAIREKMGGVELKRREIEFDQRLRELLSSDQMHQFKNEHELEEYVSQLAQEKNISASHRNQELALLKQVQRHELEGHEAEFQIRREQEQAEHEIGIKVKWDDYGRDKSLKDERTTDEIETIRRKREDEEVKLALTWRQKKQQLEREHEGELKRLERDDLAERGRIFSGMNLETMLATIEDPARRAHLLEMQQQLQAAGKTPAEILAMQAGRSPAAAAALQEMLRSNRELLESEFKERQRISDDGAKRLEEVMKKALEAVAEAAKRSGGGGPVNIVT